MINHRYKEISDAIENYAFHKAVLAGYQGGYSMGVCGDPEDFQGYAIRLVVEPGSHAFPDKVPLASREIRIIVQRNFMTPEARSAVSRFAAALVGILDDNQLFDRESWAYFCGVSRDDISKWLTDETLPSSNNLFMIWSCLDRNASRVPPEPLKAFKEMAIDDAALVSPHGKKIGASVWDYMTSPALLDFGILLNKSIDVEFVSIASGSSCVVWNLRQAREVKTAMAMASESKVRHAELIQFVEGLMDEPFDPEYRAPNDYAICAGLIAMADSLTKSEESIALLTRIASDQRPQLYLARATATILLNEHLAKNEPKS